MENFSSVIKDVNWKEILDDVLKSDEFNRVATTIVREVKQLAADLVVSGVKKSCDTVREKCNCKDINIVLYDDKALPDNEVLLIENTSDKAIEK